jgi:hypothetical protein
MVLFSLIVTEDGLNRGTLNELASVILGIYTFTNCLFSFIFENEMR